MEAPAEIEVPEWWSNGRGALIRRAALPPDHPENTYNYIKRTYHVDPEIYGVKNPNPENKGRCPHCNELI